MPYEVRPEESAKWKKDTWTTNKKEGDKTVKVEVPVSELPISYVKNIIKWIGRRYNEKYQETYIDGSKLWLELNRRAGTNPMQKETATEVSDNDLPTSMVDNSNSEVKKETKSLLLKLLDDEVKGIDEGQINLEEARDFIAGLQIKLNTIL